MDDALKEIWNHGITLESLVYGVTPWSGKDILDTSSQGKDGSDYPSDGFYALQEDYEWLSDIRKRLQSGQWAAIGYRAPRKLESSLELVPAEIIGQADFESEHSTIAGDGLTYVGVRFVSSALLGHEPLSSPRGRPTQKREIIAAYQALAVGGEVDFKAPLVRLCAKIRQKISSQTGIQTKQLKGFGNEAIRRTIRPLFDRDRNSDHSKVGKIL